MLKYLFGINISFYVAYNKTNTSLCRWSLKFVDRNTQLTLTSKSTKKKNDRKRCKICSKLTIKTVERRHGRRSGVFVVNFEHISHRFVVFLLLL